MGLFSFGKAASSQTMVFKDIVAHYRASIHRRNHRSRNSASLTDHSQIRRQRKHGPYGGMA